MKYYCYFWVGAASCYLDMLVSYRNKYIGPLVQHLLPLLNPWVILEMIFSIGISLVDLVFSIGITLVDVHLNWLNWFHFLILVGGQLVILDVIRISMSTTVSFLAQLDSGLGNPLIKQGFVFSPVIQL